MAYRIMARFYMHPDQIGEAYCIISDNADKDTKFEIGEKINIKLDKSNLTSQCSRPDKCSAESHALFRMGGYSICPHCDENISGG